MNRKDFFKKLGIGAATVVVAPKVLAEIEEPKPQFDETVYDSVYWDTKTNIAKGNMYREGDYTVLGTPSGVKIYFKKLPDVFYK